jgi:hypothetical protein
VLLNEYTNNVGDLPPTVHNQLFRASERRLIA